MSAVIIIKKSDLLVNLFVFFLFFFINILLYIGIKVVEKEVKIFVKKMFGNSWAVIKEFNL